MSKGETVRNAMIILGERTGHPELANGVILAEGYSRFSGVFKPIKEIPNPMVAYANGFNPGPDAARYEVPNIKIATELEDVYSDRAGKNPLPRQWKREDGILRSFAIQWREVHATTNWADNAVPFFHRMLEAPSPANWDPRSGFPVLNIIPEADGWLGSHQTFLGERRAPIHENAVIGSLPNSAAQNEASWLPDEYTAWVWRAYVSRNPVVKITGPSAPWAMNRLSHVGLDLHDGDEVEFSVECIGPDIDRVECYVGTELVGTISEFTGGDVDRQHPRRDRCLAPDRLCRCALADGQGHPAGRGRALGQPAILVVYP